MDMKAALGYILHYRDLTEEEMQSIMQGIITQQSTSAQIGAFLLGLQMKGPTVEEIAGAAKLLRSMALPVKVNERHLVDIVGTGGDKAHTFNISTATAFVVAAAGAYVAKHNNRAVSSHSGSADVLRIAGIKPLPKPELITQCISEVGIGFMYAPNHHRAWERTSETRRELGIRTIFNILGPLTNPANVPNILLGVYDTAWLLPIAEALKELEMHHALVVHSQDGLDEISISAPTHVVELKQGKISRYELSPEMFGMSFAPLSNLRVLSPEQSFEIISQVLENQPGPAKDIVVLNAGAALYVSGKTNTMGDGVNLAMKFIADGSAKAKLKQLREFTQQRGE